MRQKNEFVTFCFNRMLTFSLSSISLRNHIQNVIYRLQHLLHVIQKKLFASSMSSFLRIVCVPDFTMKYNIHELIKNKCYRVNYKISEK